MVSRIAIVLAVVLPLLLCLLVLLAAFASLYLRFRHQQENLHWANDKCAKLEKKLALFPKAWDGDHMDTGSSWLEVRESSDAFTSAYYTFVEKWMAHDNLSSPSRIESSARIEALLFPEPPPEHFLTAGRDTRVFPNPHQYTPTEICTLIEQNHTRESIFRHIIASVLLRAISVEDGNPFQTLLPFLPSDVYALNKLRILIRGVQLDWNVPVHISKFGVYYATKRHPQAVSERETYITLFESLFNPYFTTKSPADVTKRRLEFNIVLDAAIQLGMKVFGLSHNEIEHRWGPRQNGAIMLSPALWVLSYKEERIGSQLEYAKELGKSEVAKA